MRIAVIGNGNVGSGLALALGRAGHEVTTIGRSDDLSAAVSSAELVVLATPYGALAELAGKADFIGKTVIDVSNSVTEDFSGLQVRHKTSAAEEIASLRAGATMVKAFNTIFAKNYGKGLKVNGQPSRSMPARSSTLAISNPSASSISSSATSSVTAPRSHRAGSFLNLPPRSISHDHAN